MHLWPGRRAGNDAVTHGSLFSGIGGFDLGFERVGIQTLWQVEKDDQCRQWLASKFPSASRFAAIEDCGAHNLAPVTVITGGFPCQPASTAGKRRGTADDRWLWPEMRRIVSTLKPAWVVVENVYGLMSLNGGMVIESVFLDLESEGYDVQPFVIPACAVGAPHRRDRVWIVAYLDDGRRKSGTDISVQSEATQNSKSLDSRHGSTRITTDINGARRTHRQRLSQSSRTSRRRQPALDIGRTPQVHHWETQSGVGVLVHGVSPGMVEAFGNAIVPQIAEEIGRMLIMVEQESAIAPPNGGIRPPSTGGFRSGTEWLVHLEGEDE